MAKVYELTRETEALDFDEFVGVQEEFPYDEVAVKIERLYHAFAGRDIPKDWHKDLVLMFAPYL